MNQLGDILLERDAENAQIASAVAFAFGVSRVTIWPFSEVDDFDADVLVQRDRESGAVLQVAIDDVAADDGRLMLTDDSRRRWAAASVITAAD